jgi:hypothetical protein
LESLSSETTTFAGGDPPFARSRLPAHCDAKGRLYASLEALAGLPTQHFV